MKIYFVGSISGKKNYLKNYQAIVTLLRNSKYEVVENTIEPTEEYVKSLTDEQKVAFYKKVLSCIDSSDVMIAEVSHPSIGVGHEISVAIEKQKPVIVLHVGNYSPHFLEGLRSEKLTIMKYTLDDLSEQLRDAVEFAHNTVDTRFNFFISPKIGNYLDWISKKKRVPRAVYLRRLIEDDMKKTKEYEE